MNIDKWRVTCLMSLLDDVVKKVHNYALFCYTILYLPMVGNTIFCFW